MAPVGPKQRIWQGTLQTYFTTLRSSSSGLSSADAAKRLVARGPNEIVGQRRFAYLSQIASLLLNPLNIVLVIASTVSGLLGDVLNATIIIVMVMLSLFLNVYQTYRSEKATNSLRSGVALMAEVKRDGTNQSISRRNVVPGDVIVLSAGDLIPADARLIESHHLHVQEAALTGESLPTAKEAVDLPNTGGNITDAQNAVFFGTSVVSGSALAIVVATGRDTEFGEIAAGLATKQPETEFERGLHGFSVLITRTVFVLVLFILVVSLAQRHDPFESLLFAVALAVGLTPEFLPMITSVTLAQGAMRMAKRKVIVKNLAAIQNLGSMDIFCTDKTGTLTSGDIHLERAMDTLGNPSDTVFRLAFLNSSLETGINSPLDSAILASGSLDVSMVHKMDEIPFDFERRCLSIVIEEGGKRTLITKGAPERIIAISRDVFEEDQKIPFDDSRRQAVLSLTTMASACSVSPPGTSQE